MKRRNWEEDDDLVYTEEQTRNLQKYMKALSVIPYSVFVGVVILLVTLFGKFSGMPMEILAILLLTACALVFVCVAVWGICYVRFKNLMQAYDKKLSIDREISEIENAEKKK